MMKLLPFAGSLAIIAVLLGSAAANCDDQSLPGTELLDWPEPDLSDRMMNGAHQFVERKISEAGRKRAGHWQYDTSSAAAYIQSVAKNRDRLREIIGAVDTRLPPRMERFGDDDTPSLLIETDRYRVYQVRWAVLEGVDGEGLYVEPKGTAAARVVYVPDADQTPEQVLGLAAGIAPESQMARRMAEANFELIIPVLIDRQIMPADEVPENTNQTSREWIYRQAFHMGRHVIGYEVQKVMAAVDWFASRKMPRSNPSPSKIGVAGYAEGGLIALHAAALDQRIDAALVSGYFDSREKVWSEPIYRNVWSRLVQFGDAELASLVLPRSLVIEHAVVPEITGHKGEWKTPDNSSVESEFHRIQVLEWSAKPVLVRGNDGSAVVPGSDSAFQEFARALHVDARSITGSRTSEAKLATPVAERLPDRAARQRRAVRQLETHVQNLVRASEHVREKYFLLAAMPELANLRWNTQNKLGIHDPEPFIETAKKYREQFRVEGMGQFDEPLLSPRPRSRKLLETDRWIAYDVVLDVWPDVFAWGVLVLPKDIRPGERRPVVVCQHGRNGLPRMLVDGNETAYNRFAARLAERGFITFAPHNLYRGEDRYRWLCRKANSVQATLFSFIIAQHDQILRWLDSLPMVDGNRIGFYGLSYGGETAVRVPTILEKYALSICSGDFNQWTTKVAATDQPFTFMRTIEWEMPYWNLGHTFDYAEMSYLMIPRPFMVERGHLDRVGRDPWVAHEYAKVRWLYAQFGLADRTEIEYFQGGHSIHGQGTFKFLHKHLNWPEP